MDITLYLSPFSYHQNCQLSYARVGVLVDRILILLDVRVCLVE